MSNPTDFRAVLAALPPRSGESVCEGIAAEDAPPASRQPSDRPWQFNLRQMFRWLAAISVLFAILAAIGTAAAAVLVWILALAAVHVAANAWGTQTWQPGAVRDDPAAHCPPRRHDPAHLVHAAPASRISGEIRLGWTMLVCTACGALTGTALGGYALLAAYGHTGKFGAIAFGTTAATVLGAFLGFLSSSFLDVALRTLWEATRHSRPASPTRAASQDASE